MELVNPDMISRIDSYAAEELGLSTVTLMKRSGEAARFALSSIAEKGAKVLILAGKGNNGGDGYALADLIMDDYSVKVIDVFKEGQRSEAGRFYLDRFVSRGGTVVKGLGDLALIDEADVIVDAIFGTGFLGEPPRELMPLSERINTLSKKVLAIDVPLGVNAEDGSVHGIAIKAYATVSLSFVKTGIVSYPARDQVGRLFTSDLELPFDKISERFEFKNFFVDSSLAKKLLPERESNTNKGSFGKALLITGSAAYEGAGRLSLEASLRGGAGLVSIVSDRWLKNRLITDYPEAVYYAVLDGDDPENELLPILKKHQSILIGSGSGVSEKLYRILLSVISTEGAPAVLDADAINSIARYGSLSDIKNAKRKLILTPHPMEFSRLIGTDVLSINSERIKYAKEFAKENNCILVLKGAATLTTDGDRLFINSTGSSALAKGGSGDVLAGLLVSLLAFSRDPLETAALAVYLHGAAGDSLSEEYSEFGVTPSDLPKEIARQIKKLSSIINE